MKVRKNIFLLIASILLVGNQTQACEEGYIIGVKTGNCIKASDSCGNGCKYTIDEQGNLTVSGNSSGIWSSYIDVRKFQGNLDIISAKIIGISRVWDYSFADTPNMKSITFDDNTVAYGSNMLNSSAVENITIPKATSLDLNIIVGSNLKELILPEGLKRLDGIMHVQPSNLIGLVIPETVTNSNNNLPASSKLYCTQAQIDSRICSSAATMYERDENKNLVVYNKDGTIKGVYSDYANIIHDEVVDSYQINKNGVISVYDGRGNIKSIAKYDEGGNVITKYDEKGNVTYQRRIYTPKEAVAVTSAVKGERNTFTLKYR